jgi:hypothetical protein
MCDEDVRHKKYKYLSGERNEKKIWAYKDHAPSTFIETYTLLTKLVATSSCERRWRRHVTAYNLCLNETLNFNLNV